MSDKRTDLSEQEPVVSTSEDPQRYEDLEPTEEELSDVVGGCSGGHMPTSILQD